MTNDTTDYLVDAGESVAAVAFSFNRRHLLRAVGREILGPEHAQYAVLHMSNVAFSPAMGFAANRLASLLFGPLWSFTNWLAALRAARALRTDRALPVRIVYMTLIAKGSGVPSEVWAAFYHRNVEAVQYERSNWESLG